MKANDLDQRPRATGSRLVTDVSSRGSLHPLVGPFHSENPNTRPNALSSASGKQIASYTWYSQ